jgi:hypothetical protein
MRLLLPPLLPLLAALAGCGSPPILLGDAEDGPGFFARLTQFRADAVVPTGIGGILHALSDRGVNAAGCQLSMRGAAPRGVTATLHAGDCIAEITQDEPGPVDAGAGYSGWMP